MAPNISPKKTWEGGGRRLLLSVIAGAALAWGCRADLPAAFTPLVGALAAVPLAALAIVSDLVESVIKRRAESRHRPDNPRHRRSLDLSDSLI